MNIKCFLLEDTGKMTEFIDSISSPIYKRIDTGEEISGRNLPVGAMWYVSEENQKYYSPGPDGRTLYVQTPGGSWCIDSRASNCTKPNDNEHRCWVRHGVPPMITVDKNGNTCSAGAGSIGMHNYHGFLRNGELVDA